MPAIYTVVSRYVVGQNRVTSRYQSASFHAHILFLDGEMFSFLDLQTIFIKADCLNFLWNGFYRFLLHLADKTGGVIVTNDNFREFVTESLAWREIIQKR